MLQITVICRAGDPAVPPCEAIGWVPWEGCPIAATPALKYVTDEGWKFGDGWRLTHIPTGLQLGKINWPTVEEVMAALDRCDPRFPAWPLARGGSDCAATKACHIKFRGATAA